VLTTNIDLDEGTCSIDLLEAAPEYFGLSLAAARGIIKEVAATSTWRQVAGEIGARSSEIARMASAFDHDDLKRGLAQQPTTLDERLRHRHAANTPSSDDRWPVLESLEQHGARLRRADTEREPIFTFFGAALTTPGAVAIFVAMRASNLLKLLVRAIVLATVGLVMAVGSALAHGGAAGHSHQPAHDAFAHTGHQAGQATTAPCPDLAVTDGEQPHPANCPVDPSGHMAASGCCTIACHAALATPTVDVAGAGDLPGVRIASIADMLEGRSSDRAERPPRLG